MIRYIGSIRHVRKHATKTVPEHLKRNPKEIRVSSTGFTKLQDLTAKVILGYLLTQTGGPLVISFLKSMSERVGSDIKPL